MSRPESCSVCNREEEAGECQCEQRSYCSRECQVYDWVSHKTVCIWKKEQDKLKAKRLTHNSGPRAPVVLDAESQASPTVEAPHCQSYTTFTEATTPTKAKTVARTNSDTTLTTTPVSPKAQRSVSDNLKSHTSASAALEGAREPTVIGGAMYASSTLSSDPHARITLTKPSAITPQWPKTTPIPHSRVETSSFVRKDVHKLQANIIEDVVLDGSGSDTTSVANFYKQYNQRINPDAPDKKPEGINLSAKGHPRITANPNAAADTNTHTQQYVDLDLVTETSEHVPVKSAGSDGSVRTPSPIRTSRQGRHRRIISDSDDYGDATKRTLQNDGGESKRHKHSKSGSPRASVLPGVGITTDNAATTARSRTSTQPSVQSDPLPAPASFVKKQAPGETPRPLVSRGECVDITQNDDQDLSTERAAGVTGMLVSSQPRVPATRTSARPLTTTVKDVLSSTSGSKSLESGISAGSLEDTVSGTKDSAVATRDTREETMDETGHHDSNLALGSSSGEDSDGDSEGYGTDNLPPQIMIASARRQIESKVRPVTGTELLVVSTKEDAQGIIDVDSQIVFSEKDVDRWPQAVVSDMKVDSPSETVDRREKENQSLREEVTRLKRSALAAAERTCLLVLRIKDRECVVAQRERFISDREYERDTLWAEVEKEKIAAETKMQEAHAYGEVVHSTIEELKKRESMVKRSERDLEARDLAQAKLEGAFADKEAQMTEKMKALRQRLNDVTKLEKEAIEWKKKCERILVEHRKYVNGALDDLRKA